MTPLFPIPQRETGPFNLELNSDERYALIRALAAHEEAGLLTELFAKLVELKPVANNPRTAPAIGPGKAAAAAILSPPPAQGPVDHWAKKKPESWETIEVPISKVEEMASANGPYLRVTWPNQGRGFSTGSVWDKDLFSIVRLLEKKRATMHTVKNGKYINIVGVRA